MTIKSYITSDPGKLKDWLKDLYDWHDGHYEFISMVKDQGVYEVFYKEYDEYERD